MISSFLINKKKSQNNNSNTFTLEVKDLAQQNKVICFRLSTEKLEAKVYISTL